MQIFKQFTADQLSVMDTRVLISNVPLAVALQASQEIEWQQCHIARIGNAGSNVDISLITGPGPTSELWEFLTGDSPAPLLG